MCETKTETTIGQSMRAADEREEYDAACKKVLSEKIILAWILHGCVEEFRETDVNEIAERYIEGTPQVAKIPVLPDEKRPPVISGLSTEDSTIHEGTITYDIRFYALVPGTDDRIRLILNVEAQSNFYPGYPLLKRGIYYCSRMISAQYGTVFTESHYEKIQKVYSIWICMNPSKKRQNSIVRYSVTEDVLTGMVDEAMENYDLLTVAMICLGEPAEESPGGILKLLDVLFSREMKLEEKQNIMEDEYKIPMSRNLEREVEVMGNLGDGVYAKGTERGIEQKIQKGMEQGKEKKEVSSELFRAAILAWEAGSKIVIHKVAAACLRCPCAESME